MKAMASVSLGRVDMDEWGLAKLAPFKSAVDALEPGFHRIDLTEATFLCPAACAFLVAVQKEAQRRGVLLQIDRSTCSEALDRHLEVSSLLPGKRTSRTTIPIEHFRHEGPEVGHYLSRSWVSQLRGLSIAATEYVLFAVGEIFVNAFQHSGSSLGVVSCGQYYGKSNELHLTVVDIGVGIPATVAVFYGRREEELDGGKAIHWAFQAGHTSVPATSRGHGLAILSRFIERNDGALKVYSGRAYAQVIGTPLHRQLTWRFPGTALDIIIRGVRVVPRSKEDLF